MQKLHASPDFLHQVYFSDEAMFHVSGVVNRCNFRILGSQNPYVTCELDRVNVWAGLMHDKLIGPFLSEETRTGHSYLDMLELYALPTLPPQTIL
jgi:hypothetical protein